MRLAIVTDAWEPQVNGVVTTLRATIRELQVAGVEVLRVSPERFRSMPCPSYPEIRLALFADAAVAADLDAFDPDAIHIATEGPLGHAARAWCLAQQRRFTTSFHTRFPEYLRARWPIPLALSYAYLRRFHAAASRTLVSTVGLRAELGARGFQHLALWQRGVDTTLFRPAPRARARAEDRCFAFVGRVAVEKNVEAFLSLALPGQHWVIGDGPARPELEARFPAARFFGILRGEALARTLASADVFVFPSRSDTFGLVMLEAMACGVPVAAYPVRGPLDVVEDGVTGALDEDLRAAVDRALALRPQDCRAFAETRSWAASTQQFLDALVPARSNASRAVAMRVAG